MWTLALPGSGRRVKMKYMEEEWLYNVRIWIMIVRVVVVCFDHSLITLSHWEFFVSLKIGYSVLCVTQNRILFMSVSLFELFHLFLLDSSKDSFSATQQMFFSYRRWGRYVAGPSPAWRSHDRWRGATRANEKGKVLSAPRDLTDWRWLIRNVTTKAFDDEGISCMVAELTYWRATATRVLLLGGN